MSEWSHKITITPVPEFESIGALYEGGSKFVIAPPEPQRSWCLIDRNKQLAEYFWRPGSESLAKLFEACILHDFKTEAPSWSRLCKHIWKTHIMPEPSKVRPHPYAVNLATNKRHWHKTKCVPGWYENVTELDVKSAYAQSLANMESVLMRDNYTAFDDYGAIERWRTLYPMLDKRTRLAMIGWLASYQLTALQLNKNGGTRLHKFTMKKVYDGGVFNTIHYALYNLYKMLGEVDRVDPDNVPRIHTDSVWVDARIQTVNLERMLDIIKTNGFKLAVKGHGQSVLYNLNHGLIGGRIVGHPQSVLARWEYDRIQFPEMMTLVSPLDERFKDYTYRNERYSVAKMKAIMEKVFNVDILSQT